MAKRKKKKLTAKQAEYRKQQKRLERYIREGRKFGYEAQFNIPSMPLRVTEKALREIKRIKPKDIRRVGFTEISTGHTYYGKDYMVRLNVKKGKFPSKKHKNGKKGRGVIPSYQVAYNNLYPLIKGILEMLADYKEFLNYNYYHWSMWQVNNVQFRIGELEEKLIDILYDVDKLTFIYETKKYTDFSTFASIIHQDSVYERVISAVDNFLELLGIDIGPEIVSSINEYNSFEEEYE